MRILFLRPPRYMWPFNSESSSFWQPLGFASMASVLRENGFDVEILDCLPLKLGWKSLKNKLLEKKFDILCLGDETASAEESIKAAEFVKKNKKDVIIIGGGYFFSYMEKFALERWHFDFIIRGEGEQTLLELISFLAKRKEVKSYLPNKDKVKIKGLENINGLIYKKDGKIIINKEQQPIDMEKLPFPAYDLLPMHLYGKESKNHKDFVAIEHGRGCSGNCNFCSISAFYNYKNKPCYRTKSPEKSFQETKILVEKFKRKTFNWVDGTFNLDPKWSEKYFTLLEKNRIKVQHTAWLRSDCIIRDEKLGIMKKMADNGLVQAVIGIERLSDSENKQLNAKNKNIETSIEALKILKKYKKIYVIVTLIYGLPDDNLKKLRELRKFIYSNYLFDFPFILPFTPYPGTKIWEKYKDQFKINEFKSWNLHTPVIGTKYLTKQQLNNWFKMTMLIAILSNIKMYKKSLFEKDPRKRRIQHSLVKKIFIGFGIAVYDFITRRKSFEYGRKPKWYDD